jgi:enoyl-CoA hydratase/carnithine racemase
MKNREPTTRGPLRLVRSSRIDRYRNEGPIYEWAEKDAYVAIEKVRFKGKTGAILVYDNPPVHQVATPALHALLEGLDAASGESLGFLILYDSNDPLHAGGDLKESLRNLESTLERKAEMESRGASPVEIDRLFSWGEARLQKGVTLYGKIREMASRMRVVAVCGGGMRFGGSAEIPLMADALIGDGRGGMCFSESQIGIIPGWAGIARVLVKSGPANAEFMAKTAREVRAGELREIGVYDEVVDIPFPLPGLRRGRDAGEEQTLRDELDRHNDETGMLLLPRALESATLSAGETSPSAGGKKRSLAGKREVEREVKARANPYNYAHLWNKSLKGVREEIQRLGRPLAPQSIQAVNTLLEKYDPSAFDERRFVEEELKADAALYRDPRFLEGLRAMLEQRVADFRDLGQREEEKWVYGSALEGSPEGRKKSYV